MAEKLSNAEINQRLVSLAGWRFDEDRPAIIKNFKFKNFAQAWAFMERCAALAEKMNHHPEWSNVYGRVDVLLTTHDAGGVTQKDIIMAEKMNLYTKDNINPV